MKYSNFRGYKGKLIMNEPRWCHSSCAVFRGANSSWNCLPRGMRKMRNHFFYSSGNEETGNKLILFPGEWGINLSSSRIPKILELRKLTKQKPRNNSALYWKLFTGNPICQIQSEWFFENLWYQSINFTIFLQKHFVFKRWGIILDHTTLCYSSWVFSLIKY